MVSIEDCNRLNTMILIGRLNDRMADPALKHVSSFSALEALAYDEPTTSETAQNSDRRESSMSPKVTSRQAWGWKSRLLEAQADLSQYKRRQGRSRASPEPSISPSNNETTSPVSPQAFRRSVTPSYSPKRCDINSHTEQLSTDEQKAPLDEVFYFLLGSSIFERRHRFLKRNSSR